MSRISIRDLSDSIELDQEAMRAVLGGARTSRERLQQLNRLQARSRSSLRLVDQARQRRLGR